MTRLKVLVKMGETDPEGAQTQEYTSFGCCSHHDWGSRAGLC